MSQSPVTMVDSADPAMQEAYRQARQSFRYFYRELCWERRRIVPGLTLACVKIIFDDPVPHKQGAELMWCDEVFFDGQKVKAKLLNEPSWLKSFREGQAVSVAPKELADWMYVIGERVYGAFSVQVLRARMSRSERKQHDEAWGLDFGDPSQVHIMPPEFLRPKPGFVAKLLGGGLKPLTQEELEANEHPMAVNMSSSLIEAITQNPTMISDTDDDGFTFLHQMAFAGTANGCEILLKHGANPNATAANGMTPLRLAKALGWKKVVEVLTKHGAKQ